LAKIHFSNIGVNVKGGGLRREGLGSEWKEKRGTRGFLGTIKSEREPVKTHFFATFKN